MHKGKTGIIVLTILAAMFFLFVAILFGSSTKRQDSIDRREAINARLDIIAQTDLAIYWIGEVPPEFEHLMPVIKVIPPEQASEETLPIKVFQYQVTEYDPEGNFVSEEHPREYSDHMLIVITGNPVISDPGKEALRDSITKNGVPVIAKEGPGSSLYYCLGKGYKENPIPEEKVVAGGIDLAEAMPDIIDLGNADYVPQ